MPAPEPDTTTAPPENAEWLSEEDVKELRAAETWFHTVAPPELLVQYRGMHVAIYRDAIVDADRDWDALCRRWDADPVKFPPNRVLPRYVPSDEETAAGWW